jgi:hypothetical protein
LTARSLEAATNATMASLALRRLDTAYHTTSPPRHNKQISKPAVVGRVTMRPPAHLHLRPNHHREAAVARRHRRRGGPQQHSRPQHHSTQATRAAAGRHARPQPAAPSPCATNMYVCMYDEFTHIARNKNMI